MADRCLEFDEGVGAVVRVGRACLARLAEISVVADSALEAVADNVGRTRTSSRAQRAVAANSIMNRPVHGAEPSGTVILEWLIDGDEAMTWMDEGGVHNAARAVVPIRAILAFVADALDTLVAAVADGVVSLAATSQKTAGDFGLQPGALDSRHKGMPGVVAMAVLGEASPAEVIILASSAMDKFHLGQLLDAAVAGANGGVEEVVEDGNDPLRSVGRCGGSCLWL
jgi:hypothetical protein